MSSVDPDVVRRLKAREDERFRVAHPHSRDLLERARASMPNGVPMAWLADPATYDHLPVWVTEGTGSRFRCVDGHEYVDFNVADMSMFCGYAPEPVVEAVSRRMRAGNQFLLPVEDSIWVAEELARRWRLPKWQFTLSASQANTELIRVARVATARPRVLLFEGKYHGHFDQALVTLEDGREVPEELGLPPDVTEQTRVVPFNDLHAVARALEPRDVAVVLLEPAMTNNQGLILPDAGFHEGLRRITSETGTVLAYDETHTLVCGPGGLTTIWNLEPDAVSLGKSIAAGVPIGAYGMSEELASVFAHPAT
ncbi:MAG: aminotransferase class III-fold pyridoxal phosphate-dependent enzyme, partial [Actinobacteria bacterium]